MILRIFTAALFWALALTFAAIFLTGCTTIQGAAVVAAVRETGKAEAAAVLDGVDWYRCRGSPVGAVIDRYGASQARWDAYRLSCNGFWAAEAATPPAGH